MQDISSGGMLVRRLQRHWITRAICFYLLLTSSERITPSVTRNVSAIDWTSHINSLPPWQQDLLRDNYENEEATLALWEELSDPKTCILIVSDGCHIDPHGSFGCVIATETETLWSGQEAARGRPMSSYRAEGYGKDCMALFLVPIHCVL
jgi:hypothetical protein